MNFYKRFIGDIQRDTGHLSLAEFGAYDRLLDHYYATGSALPSDVDACCRIARAMTKDEKKAVTSVIGQYFTLTESGYIQKRVEQELSEAQPKIEANRVNGLKGGRPKGSKTKTQEKPNGFPEITQIEPNRNLSQSQSHITDVSNTQSNSNSVVPTAAASVCLALKEQGILDVNPSNPKLHALLEAGATVEEFSNFAENSAVKKFNYILAGVHGVREQALAFKPSAGQVKPKEDVAWRSNDNAIVAKANKLGISTIGKDRFQLLSAIDSKIEQQRISA